MKTCLCGLGRLLLIAVLVSLTPCYSFAKEWIKVETSSTPAKRSAHVGFTINETFYIFGGMVTPGTARTSNDAPDNDLHEFNDDNG